MHGHAAWALCGPHFQMRTRLLFGGARAARHTSHSCVYHSCTTLLLHWSHTRTAPSGPRYQMRVVELEPRNTLHTLCVHYHFSILALTPSCAIVLLSHFSRDGPVWSTLTDAQKRVVELELRDFVLGGVSLEGEAKERYNAIQQELAQLSTKFSNNVLDATKVREWFQ